MQLTPKIQETIFDPPGSKIDSCLIMAALLVSCFLIGTAFAAPWTARSAIRTNSSVGAGADPSTSWLSYAVFEAGAIITQMNATVVVPSDPTEVGADPSFWFGLQTADGTGALIQPILAWEQTYPNAWSIFHEVL